MGIPVKTLVIAGAAGAMMFGLTAASASALDLAGSSGWFHHTVQQSDIGTAACATGAVEVAMQVTGNEVTSLKLMQKTLQGCGGSEVQVAAFKANSRTPYAASSQDSIVANGLETVLTFSPPLDAQEIAHFRVTIADDVVSPFAPAK